MIQLQKYNEQNKIPLIILFCCMEENMLELKEKLKRKIENYITTQVDEFIYLLKYC